MSVARIRAQRLGVRRTCAAFAHPNGSDHPDNFNQSVTFIFNSKKLALISEIRVKLFPHPCLLPIIGSVSICG